MKRSMDTFVDGINALYAEFGFEDKEDFFDVWCKSDDKEENLSKNNEDIKIAIGAYKRILKRALTETA